MKKFGIALISLGIYCVILAFNMDVVVGTTYNIGLLNERQNIIYLSGIIFLAGIILFGFSILGNKNSESVNKFIFYCSLPALFFIVFKLTDPILKRYIEEQNQIKLKKEIQDKKIKFEREQKEKQDKKNQKLKIDFDTKFIDNKDGTITHKATNLTIQRCSLGQEWRYSTCMSIYIDPMKVTLSSIKSNKYALELFKSGWRIPTKEELSLIIYCSDNMQDNNGNCLNRGNKNGFSDMNKVSMEKIDSPAINILVFPNSPSGFYLTSSLLPNNDVWHLNFEDGYVIPRDVDSTAYVRLVRNEK